MKKIHFIANPFSGNSIAQTLPALVAKHFDEKEYDCVIKHTEYAGHATVLAKAAAKVKIDLVVAVGGDGSINEVARGLIGSETTLGILPAGSGNGFSMHLGIGRNPEKAMEYLKNGAILEMDTCKVNSIPFVNLAGVGFDANVARRIKGSTLRGFKGYLTYSLKEAVDYQMQDFEIEIDGKKINRKCFSIAVANAPMYGYGFVVAPSAKLNDGLLEVMILKAASKWRYIFEGWRFLNIYFY
jgi:diacylglycerol kinase (ATP)